MNKKGFTLIELLAVIIILAIIALIAVPTILNIIDKSKKSALEQTANGMIRAGELYYGNNLLKPNEYPIPELFYAPSFTKLETKGEKPECGQVKVDKDGKIAIAICNDQYGIVKNKADKELIITEFKGEITKERWIADLGEDFDKSQGFPGSGPTVPTYENGTAIYFNPVTGQKCDDYTQSQSTGDSNTGCLKWYIFNDEEGKDTVDMILDHNTTYKDDWNSSGSNTSGPSTASGQVLGDLKANTDGWVEVPARSDSYTDPAKGYTINYSGYKARLIEANEVWEITSSTNGQIGWNSGNTSSSSFYFEVSELSGQGTSKYPWLYDYTDSCTSYGCNVANSSAYGYWTSSADVSFSSNAWSVYSNGRLANSDVRSSYYYGVPRGVRPVITISKSEL